MTITQLSDWLINQAARVEYRQIALRVLNGTALIEHYDTAAVTNPPATEVYVNHCNNLAINLDQVGRFKPLFS